MFERRIIAWWITTALSTVLSAAEPTVRQPDDAARSEIGRRFDSPQVPGLRERLRNRAAGDVAKDSALERKTWNIGDVTREALVYVPKGEHKSAHPPVVFAFHGHGGRSEYLVRKMALHQLWPEAVCVYPQGLPTPVPVIDVEGKLPGWQKYVGDQGDRDLAFFDAMLKTLQADHAIDPQRIYVTGHSNGGFFTYVLWAARGDRFAALAPIAAGLSPRDAAVERQPTPVLHVAGENDRIVRFDTQRRTLDKLRAINQCDEVGRPAGEFCTEFRSAVGMPLVEFIHPGGHEIPETAPQRIVEFFQKHARK